MAEPVLKRVGLNNQCGTLGKTTPDKTTNILVLGDGFSASDEDLFNRIVLDITLRFFQMSPFHLFKDTIVFYQAFSASASSGISADLEVESNGSPIIPGSPFPNRNPSVGKLAEKDSALGFTYVASGGRVDVEQKIGHSLFDFVQNLYDPENSNSVIPGSWLSGGKDYGLVCVILNDDLAVYESPDPPGEDTVISYTVCTLRNNFAFRLIRDANTNVMYDPQHQVLHSPNPEEPVDTGSLATLLAHEIGHSYFNLADEYMLDRRAYQVPAVVTWLENSENIISKRQMQDSQGDIAKTDIKWLNPNKKIFPSYPVSGGSIVLPDVHKYMFPGNGTLKTLNKNKSTPVVNADGANVDVPDKEFWDEYKMKYRKPPYTSRIIGLYEANVEHPPDFYRPAGSCIMKTATGGDQRVATAYLEKLPQLAKSFDEITPDISYDPAAKLLIYYSRMYNTVYDALQKLSNDPDYQAALKQLYTVSKQRRWSPGIFFHAEFCYVCKYVIVEKLEQDAARRSDLLKKLSAEYPYLPPT